MAGYQDSQPDGPEPQPYDKPVWPHGPVEPSIHDLLGHTVTTPKAWQDQWCRLLAEGHSTNEVWYARLIRWLKRRPKAWSRSGRN